MKQPFLHDDAFLADVAATAARTIAASAGDSLHLWWLGQSGFLLLHAGSFVVLDPYLSDSLTRKYAGTDKPHTRMTHRVVDPARLDFISAVTSSHNHTDHLDPDTLAALVAANPGIQMLCPEANRATVRQRSGLPDERITGFDHHDNENGMPIWFQIPGTPFSVTPVPAAHETLERDKAGRLVFLGFLIRAGAFTLYHSGDTILFEGLEKLLRPHAVDVALLPINGRAPERRVAGNLWGREAAQLAHAIGARQVVPCHYDMFEFNTATPDEFARTCESLGQPFTVLQQGESLAISR